MEQILNTYESPYEALLEYSPFGVAIMDLDSFLIEHCNPKIAAMVGRKQDSLPGKSLLDISPLYQEGQLTSRQVLAKQLSKVQLQEEERFYWWLESKNKHRIITQVRCFTIPYTNNVALFVQDATEDWLTTIAMEDMMREVHTTDAQSALNNMVRTLAETFHLEFVYIAQANKQLTEASILALFAEGKLMDNVVYDLSISPCLELYKQETVIVYDGNLKKPYAHNPFVMKDWNVDSYVGMPLWDVSGHFLGHFAACKRGNLEHNDLLITFLQKYSAWAALQTERINRERELEQLNKDKDRLLSILSHDLRGPIGGLEVMLEMLLSDEMSQDDFRDIAVEAKRNISGLRANMETLLEWTYHQSREAKMILENFYLLEEVQSVLGFLTGMATQKEISLNHSIPSGIKVHGDRNQVNLVLRNLVSNAIKFTRPSGSVHINATLKDDKVTVAIRDTGIGIPKERVSKIFDEHQINYGTNGEKGTGLGLSLCQEIIANHGEKICLESEVGQGSSFYFTLPTAKNLATDKVQSPK